MSDSKEGRGCLWSRDRRDAGRVRTEAKSRPCRTTAQGGGPAQARLYSKHLGYLGGNPPLKQPGSALLAPQAWVEPTRRVHRWTHAPASQNRHLTSRGHRAGELVAGASSCSNRSRRWRVGVLGVAAATHRKSWPRRAREPSHHTRPASTLAHPFLARLQAWWTCGGRRTGAWAAGVVHHRGGHHPQLRTTRGRCMHVPRLGRRRRCFTLSTAAAMPGSAHFGGIAADPY